MIRKAVALLVTDKCPRRCIYCYGAGHRSQKVMTVQTAVDACLMLLPRTVRGSVTFTGGEPLSSWNRVEDIMDAVATAFARDNRPPPRFSLTTGGAGEPCQEVLAQMVLRRVTVTASLDGPPQIHDANRGEGSHALIMRWLAAFREAGVPVTRLRATLDPRTLSLLPVLRHLAGLVQQGVARGAAIEIAANLVKPDFNPQPAVTEAGRWYERHVKAGGVPFWHAVERARQGGELLSVPEPRCGACRNLVAVDPHGALWPCHRRPFTPVGTVAEGPNPEALRAWWEGILAGRRGCLRCEAWPICRGGCPAEDTAEGPSQGSCLWRRSITSLRISRREIRSPSGRKRT